ncbi:MAG TPA: wax ester/triacylglycerol synthase family O-acyltransferase [Acidimicrobiales bacterium]|nr:wax ester/triacylglycerol synthase family O-acyltransferase [Acidimicrobiales bacterium]
MKPDPLDPLDSAFITLEARGAPLHIAAVLELDHPAGGPVDPITTFDEIKALVAARLHEIPKLTKRILRVPFDLAWPVWVEDPEFDIDEHVLRRSCPSPGGEAELDALVGRIMATELPPDRPLWELSVVEGLADKRTAVILKIHHALADGVSGAVTFARLFDVSPDVREPSHRSELETADVAPLPTPLELLGRTAGELLRRPHALLEAIGVGVEQAAAMVERAVRPIEGDGGAPTSILAAGKTSLNGNPSHARRYARLHLDLAEVKAAAKRRGATVTDFAMCTVGGALRRLLESRGEPIERDLIAFMPVNVRREGAEGDLGNRISATLVRLHAGELDHEARLALIRDESRVRKGVDDQSSRFLMNLAAAVGPTIASIAGQTLYDLELFNELPPVANVTVSSVPGPPVPLWLAGRRVASAAPLGPLMGGIALNITVLGFGGFLEYGVLACAKRLPDLTPLRDLLEDEANRLLKSPAVEGAT